MVVISFLVKSGISQDVARDFTLTDIDGVEFSLSDYRGKVVVIDFFATICSPCVEEIPVLRVLHQEFNATVTIITISISPEIDTVEKLQLFRQDNNVSWIMARDTADVSSDYNINTIPTLVIVDQEGYIRNQHIGLTDQQVLREEIYRIVPEFEWPSIILVFLILTIIMAISKRKSLSNDRSIALQEPTIRSIRPWSLCL
jgi:peroxiredoxin